MTMDSFSACRRASEETVKGIRNSFLTDVPVGKICKLLKKGFEPYC